MITQKRRDYLRTYLHKYNSLHVVERSTINKTHYAKRLLKRFNEFVPFSNLKINNALFVFANIKEDNPNKQNLRSYIDDWIGAGYSELDKSERAIFVKKEFQRLQKVAL
jgi:NADH:ubiquinone oxidoreductase subunit C